MIDYEKLQQAHELLKKYRIKTKEYALLQMDFLCTDIGEDGIVKDYFTVEYILFAGTFDTRIIFKHLDDLIEKLQELIKPEPKYKIGQKWWTLGNLGKSFEVEIVGVMGGDLDLAFPDGSCRYGTAKELFPTKQALIEHQIDYWSKLKQECC